MGASDFVGIEVAPEELRRGDDVEIIIRGTMQFDAGAYLFIKAAVPATIAGQEGEVREVAMDMETAQAGRVLRRWAPKIGDVTRFRDRPELFRVVGTDEDVVMVVRLAREGPKTQADYLATPITSLTPVLPISHQTKAAILRDPIPPPAVEEVEPPPAHEEDEPIFVKSLPPDTDPNDNF